jgi:hypothetical protein
MVRRHSFLLIFILLINISSNAKDNNNFFFDFMGGTGILIPHPKLKQLGGSVSFINARLGFKTFGQKEWQRVYKLPEIGLGLSHNYLTSETIGNPTAFYSFINLPLLTESKLKLNLGINLGISWGFNQSSGTNHKNILIGSKCAAYTSLNINSSFKISQRIDLLISAEAYHISNGNTSKPNKGINMLGAETGIRYKLSKSLHQPITDPVTPLLKKTAIIVFGSWGWTQESNDFTTKVPVGSISIGYYRTINHKSRLSAGIDLFYDEGNLYSIQKDNELQNVLASGFSGGHELTFNNLSIVTQVGIYVRNPCPSDPFYYSRIGLRYNIAGKIIPSITMKAHGVAVDFIEWGIGYVLWKK